MKKCLLLMLSLTACTDPPVRPVDPCAWEKAELDEAEARVDAARAKVAKYEREDPHSPGHRVAYQEMLDEQLRKRQAFRELDACWRRPKPTSAK